MGGCGYLIKPSASVVLIAIVLYEMSALIGRGLERKNAVAALLMIMAGLVLVLGVRFGMERFTKCELREELAFSYTHYLMMGLNEETTGSYYSDDYAFSSSFATVEERTWGNMEKIAERLQEYGLAGYLQFLVKKALVNFNDGTFSWGMEGGFIMRDSYHAHTNLQNNLRQIFYTTGEHYWLYTLYAQGLWLIVQLALPCAALWNRKKGQDAKAVVMLSLLGTIAFVMLFESRARYLYNMIPIYVVAASLGISAVYGRIRKLHKKNKTAGT